MPDEIPKSTGNVRLIVFKEILEGDRRKLEAQSNDAPSGGGARDLRFPFEEFKFAFGKLFPISNNVMRRRGKKAAAVEIMCGKFYWKDGNGDASFEPPTDARGSEGRIPVIHKYPCLKTIPDKSEGMVFLLLVQHENGEVWPSYATKESLINDDWDTRVKDPILACLDASRPMGRATMGFVDYESRRTYCNGR